MQIKTRLKTVSWIAAIMSILFMFIFAWTSEQLKQAGAQHDLAEEMHATVHNRTILRDEYILYHDDRPKEQWLQQTEKLEGLFKRAQTTFVSPEERLVLQQISLYMDKTKTFFKHVIDNQAEVVNGKISIPQGQEIERRIYSQLIIDAQSLLTQFNKLQKISDQEYAFKQSRSNTLNLISVMLLVCFTIASLMMVSRSIAAPLRRLSDGIEVISTGNLDYRIDVQGNDELSDLARAGNVMAEKLGKSYISINTLEKEIERRRRTEEELRETSDYLDNLIGYANAPIIVWDPQFHITRFNHAFETLTGRKAENVIGHSLEILFPRDQVETSMELIRKALGGERWEAVEITILHADGLVHTVLWNSATLLSADGRTPVATIAQGQDITKRKQAEAALLESETRFKQLVVSLPLLVWTCRADGPCDYLSPQWIAYTGISEEQQLGYGWAKQIHPDDWPNVQNTWMESVKTGAPFDIEFRIRRNDGVYRSFKTRAAPLRNESGEIVKWFGMNMDIQDLVQAQNELKLALRDIERSNKELEQFAYVASHDLQEPLRMVSSYTQLLAERYENQLDDKAKKFIHYAVDGAVRMQLLINDLLAYSRIGTKGKPLQIVDAHAVLGEAINILKMNIEETKAIITNDELPEVRADASQLVQLFQNLIGNSVKFRGAESPRIHISVRDKGREWLFSVKDNGIGIDTEYADKVFIIFQRLHTKEEYPGSGIGLAICKKIVERLGGRIWFESEPGKGATFYFTIPK